MICQIGMGGAKLITIKRDNGKSWVDLSLQELFALVVDGIKFRTLQEAAKIEKKSYTRQSSLIVHITERNGLCPPQNSCSNTFTTAIWCITVRFRERRAC